jgi:hypothetical protein
MDYPDISAFFADLMRTVDTLAFGGGMDAPWGLYQSIKSVVRNGIPGGCKTFSAGPLFV